MLGRVGLYHIITSPFRAMGRIQIPREVGLGCFPLCQTDQSEISDPRKMERHFHIKSGQPRGMAPMNFGPFPNLPTY